MPYPHVREFPCRIDMIKAQYFLQFYSFCFIFLSLRGFSSIQIDNIYCPSCNMVVEPSPFIEFTGNQKLYACAMGGHLDDLRKNTKSHLRSTVTAFRSFPKPYKFNHFRCPVCNTSNWGESIFDVPVGPKGNQRLFACSLEHANMLLSNPESYINSKNSTISSFCSDATVMFNGFMSSIDKECVMLLLHPWVLNTKIKYSIGFIGVLILSMFLELWGEAREACRFHMMKAFGYLEKTPLIRKTSRRTFSIFSRQQPSLSRYTEPLTARRHLATRKLPRWCQLWLALMFMVHISLAYFVMLIVMTYETGLFVAVIIGLGSGFFIFKDVEGDSLLKNIDPCCST